MHPTPTPAQRFATLIHLMLQAILAQGFRGLLALPQILRIQRELKTLLQEFEQLVADIQAGRYARPAANPPIQQPAPPARPASARRRPPRPRVRPRPEKVSARPPPLRPRDPEGHHPPHRAKSLQPGGVPARPNRYDLVTK
jgi:hypothetical protein